MLEEAIQEASHQYPVFPLALSILEELQTEELFDRKEKRGNKERKELLRSDDFNPEKKLKQNGNEDEVEIVEEREEDKETLSITYDTTEELIIGNIYGVSKIDYDQLFNSKINVKKAEFEEIEYQSERISNETKSETMSTEEASEMLLDIQYGAITGTNSDKSIIEKKRFINWTIFNQELLMLFHSLYSMTGDVDYSRII